MFNLFSSKPNIKQLSAKKDVDDLIKALFYANNKLESIRKHYGQGGDAYLNDIKKNYPESFKISIDAACALADIKNNRAIPYLIKAFTGGIPSQVPYLENLDDWREAHRQPYNTASLIMAQFGEAAVDPIIFELGKDNHFYSDWEVAALGHIGSLKAIDILIKNARPLNHIMTTWALGKIGGGKEAVEFLLNTILENRDDSGIASSAFENKKFTYPPNDMLASVLEKELKDGIKHQNRYVIRGLSSALCGLNDPRGLEGLLKFRDYWEQDGSVIHSYLLFYLANFDDPRVKKILLSSLAKYTGRKYEPLTEEIETAALALANLKDTSGLNILLNMLENKDNDKENFYCPSNYYFSKKMTTSKTNAIVKALNSIKSAAKEPLLKQLGSSDPRLSQLANIILNNQPDIIDPLYFYQHQSHL